MQARFFKCGYRIICIRLLDYCYFTGLGQEDVVSFRRIGRNRHGFARNRQTIARNRHKPGRNRHKPASKGQTFLLNRPVIQVLEKNAVSRQALLF